MKAGDSRDETINDLEVRLCDQHSVRHDRKAAQTPRALSSKDYIDKDHENCRYVCR